MLVRAATPADVPAMMELARHSATAAQWQDQDYARIFSTSSPPRLAIVLEEEVIQAFLVASAIGDDWEIENVAVLPAARRRGLGTRLLGEFLDLARAQGARRVLLEVRESNAAARALYEKWAFVAQGRRPGYYRDPEEDAIVYAFEFADRNG